MTQVMRIKPVENIRVDSDQLCALYAQLGEEGAEDVVCRAIEELAVRLANCEQMWRENRFEDLRKNARSLIAISDQVGMHKLSVVARDVTICIDDRDGTAVAATLSRLMRIGERSLTAIWDMQDVPI